MAHPAGARVRKSRRWSFVFGRWEGRRKPPFLFSAEYVETKGELLG
jgi:hypothetical protein